MVGSSDTSNPLEFPERRRRCSRCSCRSCRSAADGEELRLPGGGRMRAVLNWRLKSSARQHRVTVRRAEQVCEEAEPELEESDKELRSFSPLFSSEFTEFWIRTELPRARCPPSTGLPPPPGASTAADSCVKSAREKQGGGGSAPHLQNKSRGSVRLRHFL